MSDHENARPPRAGARLSQSADGQNPKDPKYWATEHDGIKYARPFNGRFYKEKANEVKHSGAFLLPDGRSAVIINANTPHKWHWPKTDNEKKMADDAVRQYWAKYHFPPSKHYEFRERKNREGAWIKPGTPGPFGYTPVTPPPPAAARQNHANRAPQPQPQPQPAAQGQVYRPGPARPAPQDWVLAPAPPVGAWSRHGNPQQTHAQPAHQQQGQVARANFAQAQLPQMAGFNKYMQFDARTYKIIEKDPLIRECAKHVGILNRDYEMWKKKDEELKQILSDPGHQKGQPVFFTFKLPVKIIEDLEKYRTNFLSSQHQFEGKRYLSEFPPYLDLVADMNAEAIRAGRTPYLEDENTNVRKNFVLKFAYECVERQGTEHEKMEITDALAPFLFGTASNFYEYICRDLAVLLVHHHDEMEQLKNERNTAQAMDQQSGAASHGDLNAAALAYKEHRHQLEEPPKALKSHAQQVEYFVFCMKNARLDQKFRPQRMIYELIRTAEIDYEWFEVINTNISSFADAYKIYTKPIEGLVIAQPSGPSVVKYTVGPDGKTFIKEILNQ